MTNVELVRSIFAAWERGDLTGADWAHPELELVFADGPDPGSWTGRDDMAQAMRDFLRAWQDWRVEADEYRELDADRVLVLQHYTARGRTSGLPLGGPGAEGANLFHIRDGQVMKLVCYFDRRRAFADLGQSSSA